MRTVIVVSLAAAGLCAGCSTMREHASVVPLERQQTYDLAANWSSTQNPNGTWSYNHNTKPIEKQLNWQGHSGWGYEAGGGGCIIKISNPDESDNTKRRPGDIVMHGLLGAQGVNAETVNVKWTSPANGTIDIRGQAWDAGINQDRDMAWSLIVGGTTVAQRSSIRGVLRNDAQAMFTANPVKGCSLTKIPVTRGQNVEFQVVATTHYGHFVGVDEQIVLTLAPSVGQTK